MHAATHPSTVTALPVSERQRRSLGRRITLLMLLPSTLWFLLLLLMPLVIILVFSFGERSAVGGYAGGFTLGNYLNLGSRAAAFGNTLMLAPLGTLVCLVAAYPLAYFLAVKVSRNRSLLLTLVIVPFWTSFLIRTYAWIFILSGKGIPALLASLGLEDVRLINTPWAVLIGIVYGYLPLMVFPIYVSLEKLDKRLLEASADLGASAFESFRRITLPLSAPGIITGVMLVFILLMGEFLIPAILGGGKVFFVGNALVDLFLQSRNWPFGSALAMTLVAMMLVIIGVYLKLVARYGGRPADGGL
ncbi:ABC transporter permease [Pseudomonas extremaustralis]|uniref:ABC transporter permease n=1 Tax=Pseudomonas extremaustralis TaxID=359110 RepID=A0A5C5Q204_9PSED|nr:ABC transporter permease [Pseudomonas extremaustralis]EZI28647.1 ABC transporter permease [Pseudomonas extremaustralis 14-3 substr. 14-3b]TWR99701.1 ABC transporter permease [Pseudomonas extremaustralis]SDF15516.1 spermidine/putrescine transport system permease protein [Pseudomonas extremaustralis]SKB10555.1 spermidine/putrescine transport system permease protein [Pseudomonas extremaustralis]